MCLETCTCGGCSLVKQRDAITLNYEGIDEKMDELLNGYLESAERNRRTGPELATMHRFVNDIKRLIERK